MSMKKVLNWFVTIEPEEGEEAEGAPEDVKAEDPDVAAKAALETVSKRAGGEGSELDRLLAEQEKSRGGQARRVKDLNLDFDAGRLPSEQLPTGALDGDYEGSPLAVAPDEIYAEHGLPASTSPGFHVFSVEKLLSSQHLQGLDRRVKRASVLVALEANQVSIEQVLQDGIARDNALDQHEEHFQAEVELLEQRVAERVSEIEDEIAAFLDAKRQEITEERNRLRAQQDSFTDWKHTKRQEEARLFEIVDVFVDETNPITTN